MNSQEILGELTTILRDLLGDDTLVLKATTVRADIPTWDSFNYITFMVAVESKFRIKFTTSDVEAFADVGEIVEKIVDLKK
jgi:acyl carrier protein